MFHFNLLGTAPALCSLDTRTSELWTSCAGAIRFILFLIQVLESMLSVDRRHVAE
jgi:hypothetical protein